MKNRQKRPSAEAGRGGPAARPHGRTALKLIVAVGVGAFVLLMLFSSGFRKVAYRDASTVVKGAQSHSPFQGQRAFEDLRRIVDIGPRPPGSKEAENTRRIIHEELEKAGLEVREYPFEADTPVGRKTMVNVVGIVKGDQDGIILLGNHYDTKYFPDFRFVGANDAGSTTAWMIEMARTLGPKRDGRSIWLVWFDGEEALKEWSESDSLYGSREMVRLLRNREILPKVAFMINVDMIGDRYLGILRDQGAPGWLINGVWTTAAELGLSGHFLNESAAIQDDHLPFRLAGVPALNLIDFQFGGSMLDHKNTWHTPNDTLEKVSPDSLQVVGDVIYHALPSLEAYLNNVSQSR
ncbi:MAG: M28 family peptidase [Candidatus Hydrogenedentes bacterium]|nr:M28 family peptidase [Candidatus Hydrogenedentota bacterium]